MRTLYLTGALCLCALLFLNQRATAQNSNVSIGTGNVKSNAILWLKANGNQGFLLPVVADHDNFTGLNNSDDKGMVVFDSSDGKVYYWDGTAWIGVGSGASAANQLMTLSGNTLSLTGAPGSNVNLSTSAPAAGQALVWNGTAWTAVSLAGDVTGAQGSTTVNGLKGRAIPNLPATANALVYDGSAWVFQPLSSSGEANTASNVGTAGAGVFKQKAGVNLEFNKLNAGSNRVSVVSDPANSEVDIDVVQANLSLAATQITGLGPLATATSVGSAQITDGSITGADLAATTITADKLAQSGAAANQVLQWNGTNWVPATPSGSGTVTSVATGTGLTGGPITGTGTISLAAGGVTATELAANAVTSAKITDATITGADIAPTTITADKLAQSGAAANQFLQWNGTNWVPGTPSGSGTVTSVATGTGLTGGPITGTGTIALAAGGVGTTELAANAVNAAKIADASVTGSDIAAATITGNNIAATTITGANIAATTITGTNIAATTITDANLANSTITAGKLAQSGAAANQVLQWNGTNWVPANVGAGTVTSVGTGTGLTGGPISATGTISIAAGGVGTTELAANAVNAGKIADGTVTGADIAAATITGANISATTITDANIANATITAGKLAQSGAAANQILQWNGTNWVPANATSGTVTSITTGTGLTGGPISATGTISIAAGGVGTTELAANAVNSAKVADGTITGTDIAATTITGANIAATTITGANIAATTITDANIANTTITAGKLAQSGAAANQVLQWNGTNWVPANATGWALTGNAGTTAGTNYVGTSDDEPVEFKVNNVRVMRYELNTAPTTAGVLSPNIIGGYFGNSALAGIKGAVISGGGLDNPNIVNGDWATIAGGRDNQAGLMAPYSAYSTIGGGASNRSTGQWSTVAGGKNNTANGNGTTIPGGIRLIATAQGSTVVGTANEDPGALGYSSTSWAASDPVFIIGNGQVDGSGNVTTRSNAMTVLKNGNVGIGISDPTAKVDIIGSIKIADGTQGANKVLTSDANGLATWQNPGATSAGILPGNGNTGIGVNVLQSNGGDYNAAFGSFSLLSNTTGNHNAAVGYNALRNNSTTSGNVAMGYYALSSTLTTGYNTAVGWHALQSTTGGNNVGIGFNAGEGGTPNTSGANNTFIGANTGFGTGGPFNKATAIGYGALVAQSNSIALGGTGTNAVKVGINTETPGYTLQVNSAAASQVSLTSVNATSDVLFGTAATPMDGLIRYNNASDQFQLGLTNGTIRYYIDGTGLGIFRTALTNALEVEGNASNTTASAWFANSDRRIKTDIRDIDNSFELIKSLRPVKFKYTDEWKRKHPSIKDQYYYNFIAQEYQQVFPESVQSSGEYVDGDAQPVIQIDTYNAQIAAIKAVQELILKVESLEKENEILKSEKGELEARLGSFEEKQQSMLKDLETLKQLLTTTSKE